MAHRAWPSPQMDTWPLLTPATTALKFTGTFSKNETLLVDVELHHVCVLQSGLRVPSRPL